MRHLLKNLLKLYPVKFVFCYHRVIPEETAKIELVHRAMYVTPETFENHIIWMKSIGEVVGYDKLFEKSEKPVFMITFDDGWKDNLKYAYPLIKKHGVPVLIFLTSDNIDKGRLFWSEEIGLQISGSSLGHAAIAPIMKSMINDILDNSDWRLPFDQTRNDLPYLLDRMIEFLKRVSEDYKCEVLSDFYSRLKMPQHLNGHDWLLTWDEIAYLAQEGFCFGSHTHTHKILDRVDNVTIDRELVQSKKVLEEKLGQEMDTFSYPNGSFRNSYIQCSLKKYGYRYGFCLEREPVCNGDEYTIPRCLVYEDIAHSMSRYYLKLLARSIIIRNERIREILLRKTHGNNPLNFYLTRSKK